MNKHRRERLRRSNNLLGEALNIVEVVKDEEQDALDNIPENLQSSSRYEEMEEVVDKLEDAICCIEEAIEHISNAQ